MNAASYNQYLFKLHKQLIKENFYRNIIADILKDYLKYRLKQLHENASEGIYKQHWKI